jgi:hypothetical protein
MYPAICDIILWTDIGFGKFSCYYFSANRVVPSETEVRTFRRSLEILTFDELRKCLPCAVQNNPVSFGFLSGAFLCVGS